MPGSRSGPTVTPCAEEVTGTCVTAADGWLSSDIPGRDGRNRRLAAYLRSVQRKRPGFDIGANTRPWRERAGARGGTDPEISGGMKHQSPVRQSLPVYETHTCSSGFGDPRTSRTVRADCIANQSTGKRRLGRVMPSPLHAVALVIAHVFSTVSSLGPCLGSTHT